MPPNSKLVSSDNIIMSAAITSDSSPAAPVNVTSEESHEVDVSSIPSPTATNDKLSEPLQRRTSNEKRIELHSRKMMDSVTTVVRSSFDCCVV